MDSYSEAPCCYFPFLLTHNINYNSSTAAIVAVFAKLLACVSNTKTPTGFASLPAAVRYSYIQTQLLEVLESAYVLQVSLTIYQ